MGMSWFSEMGVSWFSFALMSFAWITMCVVAFINHRQLKHKNVIINRLSERIRHLEGELFQHCMAERRDKAVRAFTQKDAHQEDGHK